LQLVICNLVISQVKNLRLSATRRLYHKSQIFFHMSQTAPNLDRFLHAIADPTRRRILHALKEKGGCSLGKETGLCAFDIEQRVKLAQPTISHHMRILEKAGVVEAKREGHWRWYRRNEKLITEMTRELKGGL
jgi:DNA-binding transcriptional ArsR family regulator